MSWFIPYIGYLATVLLALSLLVTNDLKFRWLNAFGCVSFIIYGLFINALPVVVTNTLLLGINLYYLLMIYNRKEAFDILHFDWEEPVVEKFVSFYRHDIEKYFPGFIAAPAVNEIRFIVLRDMSFANIFVAERLDDETAKVRINYTIPKFRDYKVGRFIFLKENNVLKQLGVKRLVYDAVANKRHRQFLDEMGFEKTNSGGYSKILQGS